MKKWYSEYMYTKTITMEIGYKKYDVTFEYEEYDATYPDGRLIMLDRIYPQKLISIIKIGSKINLIKRLNNENINRILDKIFYLANGL